MGSINQGAVIIKNREINSYHNVYTVAVPENPFSGCPNKRRTKANDVIRKGLEGARHLLFVTELWGIFVCVFVFCLFLCMCACVCVVFFVYFFFPGGLLFLWFVFCGVFCGVFCLVFCLFGGFFGCMLAFWVHAWTK